MMKKVLFLTFLFFASFLFINNYKAKDDSCSFHKSFKDISTTNILSKFNENVLKTISKICTNDICTYSLSNDYKQMINNHKENVLESIKNEDKKIELSLKGIKIDAIYFKDCIY